MPSLFDFIQMPRQARPILEEERRRREQLMLPPAPSPTVATPMFNPLGSTPTPVDRAVANQSAMIEPSPTSRLELQRRKTRELQDFESNPVKNNDRGIGGRLLDIGRQMLVSAGQTYDKSSGDPTQRLMSAVGGGIAGAAYGGFHPQVDEERQRLYDIGRSQQLEGEIEGQIQRDQARVLTDARIADIPIDNQIKLEQIRATNQTKARTELLRRKKFDPKDPLDIQLAQEAGYNPASLVAYDDSKPNTIKIGNDVFIYKDGKFSPAGVQRSDLVDWKLRDGRVVSIPADKAAYNDTMIQMGAERIASSERMATQRITWDKEKTAKAQDLAERQFSLGQQKYRDAKTADERKAAQDLMNDALTRIDSIIKNQDLDEESKVQLLELQNVKTRLFSDMTRQQ